ncbi:MAG TPA: GIY-YIG nuclease family protein [Pyrinomonadaceae bacterium]|jgi:hypothetical protein|nr:GIY-YIG nuclease family protein [Pyrinomonadaceae bacterium]
MATSEHNIPTSKRCKRCGEEKPLEAFYKFSEGKYGRRPDCKACHNKIRAEWARTKYQPKTGRRYRRDRAPYGQGKRYEPIIAGRFLYLFHMTLDGKSVYKIGISKDPIFRLGVLRRAYQAEITFKGSFYFRNAVRQENKWHREFRQRRIFIQGCREWFRLTSDEVNLFLKTNLQMEDVK